MLRAMSYPALARFTAAAALAVAMISAPGCRKSSSHKHDRRDVVLKPGKATEINVRMAAKATVSARFAADAPLAWNTHSHPAGVTTYHSKGNSASGTLTIKANKQDVYSMMWTNKGKKPVKLHIDLDLPRGTELAKGHDDDD